MVWLTRNPSWGLMIQHNELVCIYISKFSNFTIREKPCLSQQHATIRKQRWPKYFQGVDRYKGKAFILEHYIFILIIIYPTYRLQVSCIILGNLLYYKHFPSPWGWLFRLILTLLCNSSTRLGHQPLKKKRISHW